MSRILVTGATGFVGGQVAARLCEGGHDVIAVGRQAPAEGACRAFIEADLLSESSRRAAVAAASAESMVHTAWITEPSVYWNSSRNIEWVVASLDLVQQFEARGGRRVVAVGTCAEYAWGSDRLDEFATPCSPATLYGSAKDATRRVLCSFAQESSLSLAWARLFYLYGPAEKPGRLVSDAITALREGLPFSTSQGLQRRDFMHIDDVASAIVALLLSDLSGPVNIASGNAVAVRDVLELIARFVGHRECLRFGERPQPVGEPHVIEACVRRLTEELGFKPRFDMSSGLANTIERTIGRHGEVLAKKAPI